MLHQEFLTLLRVEMMPLLKAITIGLSNYTQRRSTSMVQQIPFLQSAVRQKWGNDYGRRRS